MRVINHLQDWASILALNLGERTVVNSQVEALQIKLLRSFGGAIIKGVFPFGSYTRSTLISRHADSNGKVDLMVVFDGDSSPLTYLGWLKDFVHSQYLPSEIHPSHPNVILDLLKQRFQRKIQLVPAIKVSEDDYRVPAKPTNYTTWLNISPNDFKYKSEYFNTNANGKGFSIIRLMKYWNRVNDYPFDSYELEQSIINLHYLHCNDLWDYVLATLHGLSMSGGASFKTSKFEKLKQSCYEAKRLEQNGDWNEAYHLMTTIFPPCWGLSSDKTGLS